MRALVLFFVSLSIYLCGEYKAKDFSYLFGKVKFLNEDAIKLHLKLYEGYVKNTNTLQDLLTEMEKNKEQATITYGALKRRVGWEFNGMRLHELYFENIGAQEPISRKMQVYKAIEYSFGSYENFIKSFKASALIRGIGWVVLYKDDEKLMTAFISEHDVGNLATASALCVLDMWEHAYITQYGLDKNAYIEAFLKEVDWVKVDARFIK